MEYSAVTETSQSSNAELEAWREVHKNLTHAVLAAQEGVAAARAQRRFWMEEICADLSPEGTLSSSSVWKRPTATRASRKAPRKNAAKSEKGPAAKRKKKSKADDGPKQKKAKTTGKRRKKAMDEGDAGVDESEASPTKKTKIRLSLKKPSSDEEDTPSPEQEQMAPSYAGWSVGKQFHRPPPPPPPPPPHGIPQYGMHMHQPPPGVPPELLPFLSHDAPPVVPVHPSFQNPSQYPNAYATLAQAPSSDDESSEED